MPPALPAAMKHDSLPKSIPITDMLLSCLLGGFTRRWGALLLRKCCNCSDARETGFCCCCCCCSQLNTQNKNVCCIFRHTARCWLAGWCLLLGGVSGTRRRCCVFGYVCVLFRRLAAGWLGWEQTGANRVYNVDALTGALHNGSGCWLGRVWINANARDKQQRQTCVKCECEC